MRPSFPRLSACLGAAIALVCSGCLSVRIVPDRPEYAQATHAARSNVQVQVTPLVMAITRAPRCVPASSASCFRSIPVVQAAYLVRHPKGTFLIESGLSQRGRQDIARFPLRARVAFETQIVSSLAARLREQGSPKLDFVILTHAHWDHTSGLADLLHPTVIMPREEIEFVREWPKHRVDPGVMPDHLEGARVKPIEWDGPAYENFPKSHDVFGDGSVVLVPLPGHTPGSVGVFVEQVGGARLLFIGDSSWSVDGVSGPSHRLRPLAKFVDDDLPTLGQALWRLHHLQERDPDLVIVPTHDGEALERVRALGHPR